jgi:aminopeptidase-like protein
MGSEYYLGKGYKGRREKILECICLWMLGSRTGLALQESRQGRSNIEYAIARIMDERGIPYRQGEFESIIINDEYIWEAYGIPTCSLSRMPYPEYHSSRDNLSIISEVVLSEAVEILESTIEFLESSELIYKKFEGNICLSNPRYNLYVDPGQISFGEKPTDEVIKMRLLMDLIPTLHKPVTMRYLAEMVCLEEHKVSEYLSKWASKGLLDIK